MRAVRYHEYGDADVLEIDHVERPEPGPGELLVAVRAVSVNPVDGLYRSGVLAGGDGAFEKTHLPATTGTDVAGEVAAIGGDVTEFEVGERVFGTGLADASRATAAEYAIVPESHLARLPSGVEFRQGAGIAHVGGTAWRALEHYGNVSPGDTVLIHGASGGVGHVAVQLAAMAGARVIGTASSERARTLAGDLGADTVFDYKRDDLDDAIGDAVGSGADIILDPHTGDYLPLDIEVAAVGGRITHLNGAFPPMEQPAATRTKELTIQGVAMHNTPNIGAVMARLARLLNSEDVHVHVDRTYDLEETAAAQRALENEHVVGKLVVET